MAMKTINDLPGPVLVLTDEQVKALLVGASGDGIPVYCEWILVGFNQAESVNGHFLVRTTPEVVNGDDSAASDDSYHFYVHRAIAKWVPFGRHLLAITDQAGEADPAIWIAHRDSRELLAAASGEKLIRRTLPHPEDRWPDTQGVVPKDGDIDLALSRDILESLNQVLATSKAPYLALSLKTATNPDNGRRHVTVMRFATSEVAGVAMPLRCDVPRGGWDSIERLSRGEPV